MLFTKPWMVSCSPNYQQQILHEETERLMATSSMVFDLNPLRSSLDLEITKKSNVIVMERKVVRLQALARGWLCRRRRRPYDPTHGTGTVFEPRQEMGKEMKNINKRWRCIAEIVATEKTYVSNLQVSYRSYYISYSIHAWFHVDPIQPQIRYLWTVSRSRYKLRRR